MSDTPVIQSLGEFAAHVQAMEEEAVERYTELAHALEVHNNKETAALFYRLAEIEGKHAGNAGKRFPDLVIPRIKPWDFKWVTAESPEAAPHNRGHYLMTPYHALHVARENELRGIQFLQHVVATCPDRQAVTFAKDLIVEEQEHVALLDEWLAKTPKPDEGWDDDPDPPVIQE